MLVCENGAFHGHFTSFHENDIRKFNLNDACTIGVAKPATWPGRVRVSVRSGYTRSRGIGRSCRLNRNFRRRRTRLTTVTSRRKSMRKCPKLRAGVDASPTTPRRWVWELIQNAKDVNIERQGPRAHRSRPGRLGCARHLQAQRRRVLRGEYSFPYRASLVEGPDE